MQQDTPADVPPEDYETIVQIDKRLSALEDETDTLLDWRSDILDRHGVEHLGDQS